MSEVQHYLIWVGGGYYSLEQFLDEAKRMGISRRISRVPRGLKIGESRVYLISDMTEADKAKNKEIIKRNKALRHRWSQEHGNSKGFQGGEPLSHSVPNIFAYFIVRGISYIVGPGTDIPEKLKELGVKKYEYIPGGYGFNDERGCGSLVIGGTYLLSEEDFEKCRELADSALLEGRVIILDPPIPYTGKHFRGLKKFEGEAVHV